MSNSQTHESCQCPNCSMNTSSQTQIDIRITSYGERTSLIRFPKKTSLICCLYDDDDDRRQPNSSSEWSIGRRMSMRSCDELNELRCNAQLCDVVLKCDDGAEFLAHKVVLSAVSRFFRALFTNGMNESRLDLIHIGEIDSKIMQLIIEWSYTRNIVIDSSNIEKILPAADRFQLYGLTSKCIEFLIKSLHYENVIGIKKFASYYSSHQSVLRNACDNFLMENFLSIANSSQEFLELNIDDVKSIILADELNIKKESNIFEVIIRWIDYNFNDRRKYLPDLIGCLKLGYISKKYFIEKIKNHPYVKDQADMRTVLADAIQFFIYSFNSNYVDLSDLRVRPRIPHELMFVVGGWSTGAPTNKIETFDPRADLWQLVESNEFFPRAYHGCIFLDKFIYVIGGFIVFEDNLNYFNDCRRFNVVSNSWEEIAPMHVKRCYVSVATYKGIIYALGGFDGFLRQYTAEKYQPESNQWTLIAPMHEARSDASAAELDGKIYICGGFNGIDCVDSAEYYDPTSNQWTLITPMTSRRSGVGVVAYNRAIYAVGGYNGVERLNTCERFDLRTRQWISLPQMYSPRSNFGIEVFDGCIFVIGGYNGSTTIENVESFDEEQNEWKLREKMKINRSALSVCIVKGIEIVRPYSALKIERNLKQKRNFEFIRNLDNLSNSYYSYININ